jgi:hypothetical protein
MYIVRLTLCTSPFCIQYPLQLLINMKGEPQCQNHYHVTGGIQRGLFQNKPALLVRGLCAAYAWLIGSDSDKIRSVDLVDKGFPSGKITIARYCEPTSIPRDIVIQTQTIYEASLIFLKKMCPSESSSSVSHARCVCIFS